MPTCDYTRAHATSITRGGSGTVMCIGPTKPAKKSATAPNEAMSPSDIVVPPAWCDAKLPVEDGGGYVTVYWQYTRFDACRNYDVGLYSYRYDEPTETLVQNGYFTLSEYDYARANSTIENWAMQSVMALSNPEGVFSAGANVDTEVDCLSGCTVIGSNVNGAELTPTNTITVDALFTTDVSTGEGYGIPAFEFEFYAEGTELPGMWAAVSPYVRCDTELKGQTSTGCVFYTYAPDMVYQLSGPYPELARHIQAAQASGLKNWLSRSYDDVAAAANRATACPGTFPRPTGDDCDEYPFASSLEGANNSGGGPRTFDWCSISLTGPPSAGPYGYSVCMINSSQNRGGGGALNAFFVANRIIDFDEYFVLITP